MNINAMKNIVIVGGSAGIGSELGKILSKNHKVLLLARNEEQLKLVQSDCGENSLIKSIDLRSTTLKQDLVKLLEVHFPQVDILINNAGYLVNKPFLDLSADDIENSLATNVTGLVKTCQAVIPFMKNGGHIVNIGSMGGFQGSSKFPGLSIYSASKGAVATLSECLAEELKEANIQVNCLALGAAQTKMLENAFPGYKAPVSAKKMAEYIAEFSLTANQWMNGKVIPVALSTP
jgi:3-oxoacyl-[acyl-carrier protein] reductase